MARGLSLDPDHRSIIWKAGHIDIYLIVGGRRVRDDEICTQGVAGSIPAAGTSKINDL